MMYKFLNIRLGNGENEDLVFFFFIDLLFYYLIPQCKHKLMAWRTVFTIIKQSHSLSLVLFKVCSMDDTSLQNLPVCNEIGREIEKSIYKLL